MSEIRAIEPSRIGRDRAHQSVLGAKSHLLAWAQEHDARRKGPWPIIGAVVAGGAAMMLVRAALSSRRVSNSGVPAARGSTSLIAGVAQPLMRVVVAGRMAYWLWNQVGGRTQSAMGLARGSRTMSRDGAGSDLPQHSR